MLNSKSAKPEVACIPTRSAAEDAPAGLGRSSHRPRTSAAAQHVAQVRPCFKCCDSRTHVSTNEAGSGLLGEVLQYHVL